MWNAILSGLWQRKRRLVGTATAVVLGVAFLTATLVMGDTTRAGFRQAFTDANAGLDVLVRSSEEMGSEETRVRDQIDATLLDQVASVDGVAAAVAQIDGVGTILGADGERVGGGGPPTTATNWIEDPALNPYRLAEGRAPDGPDEIVIDRGAAEAGDLTVGARTTVLTPQPVEVTVVGIATFGDVDSLGPTTYAAFTFERAQQLFAHRPDAISSILVTAEDRVSQETLRDEISELLPARIEALTQGELTAEQEGDIEDDFLGMFEMILLAFAGVAVVVAAFSIHNTFSILVAQRTRESALLRAVGASRRQVVTAVAAEALAVGVLASAIGFGVGLALAGGLKALMAGAGVELPTAGLVIDAGTVVVAAIVGVGTTLLASVAPAVTASRVAPLAALRDVAVDRSAASRLRAALGAVVTGVGVVLVSAAGSSPEGAVSRAGLGALAVLVGTVILGPVVARPAAAVLGSVAAVSRGFTGRLARRNAMRNPRRIAGSASALMVGTAVVALFTTFGSSVKASIDHAVDGTFGGDLIVLRDDFSGAGLSPHVAPAIAALPEVADVVAASDVPTTIDGRDALPTVTDPAGFAALLDVDVSEGSLAELARGELAISRLYADEHALTLGDDVTMGFLDGASVDLRIGAIYERSDVMGDLIMSRGDAAAHAGQAMDLIVFVDLAPGVTIAEGQTAVDAVTGELGAPDSQTRDEYVDSMGAQIDQMLAVIYGLLGVAVLIALMGIGNTLALSIHERTRELGLLRAVGQSRSQLRSTVRWESVLVAVFGTIGGLAAGTFLGWGLVQAIQAQEGFGTFALPTTSLVVVLVLAVVAGVVAAIRPARRAARLDILAAISTD